MTVFLDEESHDGAVKRRPATVGQTNMSPAQTAQEFRAAGFWAISVYGGFDGQHLYAPTVEG